MKSADRGPSSQRWTSWRESGACAALGSLPPARGNSTLVRAFSNLPGVTWGSAQGSWSQRLAAEPQMFVRVFVRERVLSVVVLAGDLAHQLLLSPILPEGRARQYRPASIVCAGFTRQSVPKTSPLTRTHRTRGRSSQHARTGNWRIRREQTASK